jgi:hypothetical protein
MENVCRPLRYTKKSLNQVTPLTFKYKAWETPISAYPAINGGSINGMIRNAKQEGSRVMSSTPSHFAITKYD